MGSVIFGIEKGHVKLHLHNFGSITFLLLSWDEESELPLSPAKFLGEAITSPAFPCTPSQFNQSQSSRFPPITLWKSMLSNGAKIWTTMLSFGLCMQSWLCMEMLTLITMKSLLPHVVDSIIIFLTYLRDRLVYVAKRACIPRAGGSPKNTRTWLVLHIQFRCSESDSRGSAEGGYSLNS